MEVVEQAIFRCGACQKVFSTNFNLRKHVRKFHPDKVNVLAPTKAYNFQCSRCNRNFTHLKRFRIHERRHNAPCTIKKEKKCAICDYCGLETDILDHFTRIHNIKLEHTFMRFVSLNEFHTWKTSIENESRVQFIKKQKPFSTKAGQVFKYVCHRSGTFNSKSLGIRRLKSQGSKKIGGYCPASMKLILKDDEKCEVTFLNTHVGHRNDVHHLWLSSSERKTIAAKIAKQIPFKDILVEAHDARTERVKLLKRKDLHNIKRSFKLQYVCQENGKEPRNEDGNVDESQADDKEVLNPIWDDDSVVEESPENVQNLDIVLPVAEINNEDSLLQQRKEKLKSSLCQFINEISCSEEADALEEAFAHLMSTLKSSKKNKDESKDEGSEHNYCSQEPLYLINEKGMPKLATSFVM